MGAWAEDREMYLRWPLVCLALTTVLLAAPTTAAQSDPNGPDARFAADRAACDAYVVNDTDTRCIVHYAHILDILNRAPLSVHRPPDDAPDLARGHNQVVGHESLWDLNQLTLVPSTGRADYDHDPEKDPAVEGVHGLARNLSLDPQIPIFGYWYMSTDAAPGVAAYPCLTVRMTLETGRHPGQGEVLTSGEITKTITTTGSDAPTHTCPDGREAIPAPSGVVPFEIEMPPVQRMITADEGYTITVEWWNHAPPDGGDKTYVQPWRIHTGPEHAPRIVLPVDRPLNAESGRIVSDGGKTYLQGYFHSPFGEGDVDPESLRFDVLDPTGTPLEVTLSGPPHIHQDTDVMSFFAPFRASVIWDHQKDALPPGQYTLRMSAQNWQGSHGSHADWHLVIPEEHPAPAAALPLLLGPLVLGVLLGRRRVHRNP